MFSHFSQRTIPIFRHSLSVKEILEMPQNMYNGQRVRSSDSHSRLCSPSPHLYTGCAPEGTGDFLIAFKEDWQKCPYNQTDPPCLPGNLFPSTPADLSWASLTSTRHTHLASNAFPRAASFLSLNHYRKQAHYEASTGSATSAGPSLHQNLH